MLTVMKIVTLIAAALAILVRKMYNKGQSISAIQMIQRIITVLLRAIIAPMALLYNLLLRPRFCQSPPNLSKCMTNRADVFPRAKIRKIAVHAKPSQIDLFG